MKVTVMAVAAAVIGLAAAGAWWRWGTSFPRHWFRRRSFAEEHRHELGLDDVPNEFREVMEKSMDEWDISQAMADALLGDLILDLSDFEYRVFVVRCVEGRTRTETAELLGCSVSDLAELEKSIQVKRV